MPPIPLSASHRQTHNHSHGHAPASAVLPDPGAPEIIMPAGGKATDLDDYDPALEAEIDQFYKTVLPDDEAVMRPGEENWEDDGEGIDPLLPKHSDGAEEPTAETLPPRALQLELLAQSNEPNAFVTVRRMYQFFELQLWEVLPVITLKELMEEMTEVAPQDMKLYLKNGTILEDKKLLRDYGVNTSIHTCDHPAEVFVGFRVDLDDLTEDEEEEDDEAEAALDVSPDFEYFETVSDIDFSNEILRDRDFDEEEEDVLFNRKLHKVNVPMRFTGDPLLLNGYDMAKMKKVPGGLKDVMEDQKPPESATV